MESSVQRKSNFELLRILSMLMIVMHHYICHGGFQLDSDLTINKIIIECAYWGGKVGINIFILITGYFMINSKPNIKKVFILWGELFFYSVIITVIFMLMGIEPLSISSVVKAIFPLTLGRHNYLTTYIFLYCLSPFINKLVNNISKLELNKLIIFLFVILSIVPTICEIKFGWINNTYSYLLWMIFVYFVGADIRLYYSEKNKKNMKLITLCSIFVIWILTVICGELEFVDTFYFVTNTYTVPVFISSVCIFVLFESINIKYNKWINFFAASTLAVYCIHDELIRYYVWKEVFKGYLVSDSILLLLNIIFTVLIMFVVCVLVDKVRIFAVEKNYIRILDKYEIHKKAANFHNKLIER